MTYIPSKIKIFSFAPFGSTSTVFFEIHITMTSLCRLYSYPIFMKMPNELRSALTYFFYVRKTQERNCNSICVHLFQDKFLPFIDMFQKDSVKVEVCKSITEAYVK